MIVLQNKEFIGRGKIKMRKKVRNIIIAGVLFCIAAISGYIYIYVIVREPGTVGVLSENFSKVPGLVCYGAA